VGVEAGEVVLDERRLPGRQGRLLFAYLVMANGRPVPRDELAQALWGDAVPTTWDKALSVLLSKLRRMLSEAGIDGGSALTAAFGCYRLDLPDGTWVDVLRADDAVHEATARLAADRLAEATEAAAFAESVARLPFLPGDDGSWVDAKRRELADVRVRALSVLSEASLRSGEATVAAHWAELEVDLEPFREIGHRHLMAAQIAAGNRAEALQVYERCRQLLAEELGAYPSPETESVYRGLLEAPGPVDVQPTSRQPAALVHRRPRLPPLVGAMVVLAAIAAAAVAVVATRGEGSGASTAAGTARVALVVALSSPGTVDASAQYQAALNRARSLYDIRAQTFQIDLSKPGLSAQVRRSIGNFDLVLLAGQFVDARFAGQIAEHPHTRFVVMDPDPENEPTSLYSAVSTLPNATDMFFIEGPGAYLAGYLSALMAKRRVAGNHAVVVSVIAGDPRVNENPIAGFTHGAEDAVPGAIVLRTYSHDFTHPPVCATIANRQVDRGSAAIFADAGACSIGALSAAGVRGVWGVGADEDMSDLGSQILVSTVKRLGRSVDYAIRAYLGGTLPQGHLDIGIERGAVDIVGINPAVPASIRAELERVKQEHMSVWESWGRHR
jgi:basic membrane lipoprotein Med (substrate-binding protein (PBP1-ABC) superfamily)/DNA-binding SARP family transcriptional activator